MTRVQREKKTVEQMITMYCKEQHSHSHLCPGCSSVLKYAHERLDTCKFGEHKTACKQCKVHCYRPEMREQIRIIMRYSGPRMIWHHPISTILYLFNKSK